jgi:DNA polymerase-3 subunit beta
MKVSCLQENFSKGLSIVGRAVGRGPLPQTSHVLLATDNGRLKLAATNLEIAMTCWIGAKVEEEGMITVPARLLGDFVNSLPNEPIEVTLPARTRQLRIACARNEATVAGMEANDFPPIPAVRDGISLFLDPESLRKAINQVEFAAAMDDTRRALTGIDLLMEDRQLTLAAADGFRLAVHRLALDQDVPERAEVIIPARALREVNRLLPDEEEPVEMTLNAARSQVLFRLKDVEMVSQLIPESFPNYERLIPDSHVCRAVVDVAEFLRETRIAAIFARDGGGRIGLEMTPGEDLTPGKLAISARAEEIGDNRGEIDATLEGEAAKIAFNSRYLQEVLQVLDCAQVALETSSPRSPGVLRPLGQDNYVHVVMPMSDGW